RGARPVAQCRLELYAARISAWGQPHDRPDVCAGLAAPDGDVHDPAWQLRRVHHHTAGRGRADPLDLRARSAGFGSCDRRARGTVDRQQSYDPADDAVAAALWSGGRMRALIT